LKELSNLYDSVRIALARKIAFDALGNWLPKCGNAFEGLLGVKSPGNQNARIIRG
jgi:hypothetical protein